MVIREEKMRFFMAVVRHRNKMEVLQLNLLKMKRKD
jgi:hypothetical protein